MRYAQILTGITLFTPLGMSPVFIPLGGASVYPAWRAQCLSRLAGPVFIPLGGASIYPAWREASVYPAWREASIYPAWREASVYPAWRKASVYPAWREASIYPAWQAQYLSRLAGFQLPLRPAGKMRLFGSRRISSLRTP